MINFSRKKCITPLGVVHLVNAPPQQNQTTKCMLRIHCPMCCRGLILSFCRRVCRDRHPCRCAIIGLLLRILSKLPPAQVHGPRPPLGEAGMAPLAPPVRYAHTCPQILSEFCISAVWRRFPLLMGASTLCRPLCCWAPRPIDEADRILQQGFQDEMREILDILPKTRQPRGALGANGQVMGGRKNKGAKALCSQQSQKSPQFISYSPVESIHLSEAFSDVGRKHFTFGFLGAAGSFQGFCPASWEVFAFRGQPKLAFYNLPGV